MTKLIIEMDELNFCTVKNDSTGESWVWSAEELENERKKYLKEHKKYLRFLERCEKNSNNAKKKEIEIKSKFGFCKRKTNYIFHCYSKEIVQLALEQNATEIVLIKHNKKDRRYKKGNFDAYKIDWFYEKLMYKSQNEGIQFSFSKEKNVV